MGAIGHGGCTEAGVGVSARGALGNSFDGYAEKINESVANP